MDCSNNQHWQLCSPSRPPLQAPASVSGSHATSSFPVTWPMRHLDAAPPPPITTMATTVTILAIQTVKLEHEPATDDALSPRGNCNECDKTRTHTHTHTVLSNFSWLLEPKQWCRWGLIKEEDVNGESTERRRAEEGWCRLYSTSMRPLGGRCGIFISRSWRPSKWPSTFTPLDIFTAGRDDVHLLWTLAGSRRSWMEAVTTHGTTYKFIIV